MGKNKGGRPTIVMDDAAVDQLRNGIDIATADGQLELAWRLLKENLTGRIGVERVKACGPLLNNMRSNAFEGNKDRRAKRVTKAVDELKEMRLQGRKLRDVGPPPDGRGSAA